MNSLIEIKQKTDFAIQAVEEICDASIIQAEQISNVAQTNSVTAEEFALQTQFLKNLISQFTLN